MRPSEARLFGSQNDRGQGRESEEELPALERSLRLDPAAIPEIASPIAGRVGVDELSPGAGFGNRKPIALPRNGRHVAHDQQQRAVAAFAQVAINRIRTVVGDYPLKSVRVVVSAVKCLKLAVDGVEIDDQALDASMERKVE